MKPYNVAPQLIPEGEKFRLTNVVTFYGTKDESWTINPGRCRRRGLTDFASVPRLAVWLIPKFGKITAAAILHDWFCDEGIANGVISPRDADGVFRSVMRRDGVPRLLRALAWCGVRWGAAFNPIRRHEWWSDFPAVFALSLVGLPIMLLAAIGIGVGLFLYHVFEWICSVIFDEVPETEAGLST